MKNDKLLREYIKAIIKEDGDGGGSDGGFGGMGGEGGMSGGGMYGGYGDMSHVKRLFDIFADPFRIGSAEVQKLIPNINAVIRIFFESIMTTIVPFLDSDYDEIFKKRDEAVKKVEQKYGDVYKRMWDSFAGGGAEDLLILSFMMNPGLFMAGAAFWKVPEKAAAATEFISGGEVGEYANSVISLGKNAANFIIGDKSSIAKSYKRFESVERLYESFITEDEKPKAVRNYSKAIKEFRKSSEFDEMLNSSRAKEVAKDAYNVMSNSLSDVVNSAKKRMSAINSFQDVENMLGEKATEVSQQLAKLDDSDKAQFEKQIVESTRDNIKAYYVTKLTDDLKKAKSSGLPDGTKLESMFKHAISSLS